jgi:porin
MASPFLPSLLAAQESQQPEPGPKYGGNPRERPKLTGDWGGTRNAWAEGGLTLDLDATYTFQSVVGGGWTGPGFKAASNEDSQGNTLSGDLKVELDTGKAGLWSGGFINARVEGRYGRSVLQRAGTVSAVNNDALFPNVVDRFDEEALAVTELSVTQSIGGGISLFGGLLNPSEGDENEIAGSALSNGTFFNTALLYSLVEDATVPNVSLGGGAEFEASETISGSFSVFGTTETAGKNPFDRWHGTTFSTEWTFGVTLGERPGTHTVGALYGIHARRTDIAADPRIFLGAGLQGRPVPETTADTWALYYNGHHFLSGDAKGGWGVFARAGLSDGDPNPVRWNGALGLGGVGTLPTRPEDHWGAGVFYLGRSNAVLLKGLGVGNEVGGEVYYKIVLTPWVQVTLDAQVVDSALPGRDTAWVLGLRTHFVF